METVSTPCEDLEPAIEEDTADESWFWTEENQRRYREALEDLEQGRYRDFDNVDDLLKHLKSLA